MAADKESPIQLLGRYAICSSIGAGGMATVHIGRLLGPVGFSRTVAIKKMHAHLAQDPEFLTMFLEEARLAARVQHANVVSTLDVVTAGGELFHVMEYVEGASLAKILQALSRAAVRLPVAVVGSIVSQICHGLHSVHESKGEDGRPLGLIHRDISPDNILVGRDGIARVLDFGIAKATEHGRRTQQGKVKGKVPYMAPEQLRGKELDRRCDVYSAAAVLFEALTGRRWILGDSDAEMIHSLLRLQPTAPSSLVPSLSPQIDAVAARGLAASPNDRFATAKELATAIERALGVASPSTVSELVESTMGAELAHRAALVESAVKVTSRLRNAVVTPAEEQSARSSMPDSVSSRAMLEVAGTEVIAAQSTSTPPKYNPPGVGAVKPFQPASLASPAQRPSEASSGFELPALELDLPPQPAAPAAAPAEAGKVSRAPDVPRTAVDLAPAALARPLLPPAPAPDAQRMRASLDVDFGAPASPAFPQTQVMMRPANVPPASHAQASSYQPVSPASYMAARPKSGGGVAKILVPLLLAGMVLAAVALVIVLKRVDPSTAGSTSAAPPTREEIDACELLRKRVRSGGQPTGLSRAGWAVELWLRGPGGKRIAESEVDITSFKTADSDVVEVSSLRVPGKSYDEGLRVRIRGATAESAFDAQSAAKLVKAADRAFERTVADAGALYMGCAHLPSHDLGLWFRGRDAVQASSALLVALGMFSDAPFVNDDALNGPQTRPEMTAFDRVKMRLGSTKVAELNNEMERYGATVSEMETGGVRLTFPTDRLGDAMRASRVIADKAGVENL